MAAEPKRTLDQALPRRIGRYEAFLQIGAGGMARVYLAVQRGTAGQKAELVVVKVLRPEAVEDEHAPALFADEARIAMRLQHPNVIRTREVVAEPPDYLLAMDFQNGQSLLDVVSRLGRHAVPLDEHIYILTKVLAGLSYAHELKDENGQPFGIVHRDVSPANVLVTYSGEVKLLDFGIAKATGALAATRDGVVKGKLGYAAPEQCLGQPADPRSDIYAVGVMLWEAIAGRRRASGETWQSVLQARLEDAEPRLEDVCPDAPPELVAIVQKALAREPADRYATATEFRAELEGYLTEKRAAKIGAARIVAMLKPHFDKDRVELHRTVEAFLKSLKSKTGTVRRIPLPGGAATPTAATSKLEPPAKAPGAQDEHTAPIPVDAALLMLSRGEPAQTGSESPTPPHPARAVESLAPPNSGTPTAPPPNSGTPTAPPPNSLATTAPPPPGSLAPTPPSSARTAPPPPGAIVPSPSADRGEASTAEGAPSPDVAPAILPSLPRSPSLPTDAYGLVTVKPVVGGHMAASIDTPVPKRKARALPLLLVAAGIAGLAGFAVLAQSTTKGNAAASPVTPPAGYTSPKPAQPEAPKVETVNVRISVDPADAVVKLDGTVLSGNPFVGAVPKDDGAHELTVFAEGCRDVKQSVHLSRDVGLLIAMKCSKQSARANGRSAAPRIAAAAAPAPVAAPRPAATSAPTATATAEAQPTAAPPEPAKEPQAAPAEPAPKAGASDLHLYGTDLLGPR